LKRCLSACAGLEERMFLRFARITDSWADRAEARWGKMWFLVPGWRWKVRVFRWCAGLDRRFINWLG